MRQLVEAGLIAGGVAFAFNAGGILYLFDMRQPPRKGEYPVACTHAADLG